MRVGVGIVVVDPGDRILVIERRQMPGHWQMPQGGLEEDEEPLAAAWRELEEETGLTRHDVEFLRAHERWLAYELPAEHRSDKTGRGQVQQWFLFRCRATAPPLRLGKEAIAVAWWPAERLLHEAVAFRRDIYSEVLTSFGLLPTAPRHLDYLRLEFEHCAQSMLSNEELGDRRFSNYLTFVAFLVAALGLMASQRSDVFRSSAVIACAIAASLGLLTFLRIVARNQQATRMLEAIHRIRRVLASGLSWDASPFPQLKTRRFSLRNGGIAESLALIISLLAGAGTIALLWQCDVVAAVLSGVLTGLTSWLLLARHATTVYARRQNPDDRT